MDFFQLAEYGLGTVSIIGMAFIVKLFLDNNRTSNRLVEHSIKVVSDNTKAINRLATTLERRDIIDEQFRTNLLELSKETNQGVAEVKIMVTDIHRKVVE